MNPREVRYTSGQVCRITGVTMRQLDGWCRKGLICPSGNNPNVQTHQRLWTAGNILCIALLRRVSAATSNLRFLSTALGDLEAANQADAVDLTLRIDLSDVTATLATLNPINQRNDLDEARARRHKPTRPNTNIDSQPTPDPEPLLPRQRITETSETDGAGSADLEGFTFAAGMVATLGKPNAGGRMIAAGGSFSPFAHRPRG